MTPRAREGMVTKRTDYPWELLGEWKGVGHHPIRVGDVVRVEGAETNRAYDAKVIEIRSVTRGLREGKVDLLVYGGRKNQEQYRTVGAERVLSRRRGQRES